MRDLAVRRQHDSPDGADVHPGGTAPAEIGLEQRCQRCPRGQGGQGRRDEARHLTQPPDLGAGHAEGWAHYLGRLAQVAAGRDLGPDPWHGRTGRE